MKGLLGSVVRRTVLIEVVPLVHAFVLVGVIVGGDCVNVIVPSGFRGFGATVARMYLLLASGGRKVVVFRMFLRCCDEKSIGACLNLDALNPVS